MSTADKLQRAIALIEEHNSALDPQDPETKPIDIQDFQRKLKREGGTTEAALSSATWELIERCGLPSFLARAVADIFRKPSVAGNEPKLYTERQAQKMAPLYLLQAYKPNNPPDEVSKRLRELSKDQPFIVLNADGSVDVQTSHSLLQDLIRGYEPQKVAKRSDGTLAEVIKVGQRSLEVVNENPLFVGVKLRNGDWDDQLNRSWAPVPLRVRQLVNIAVHQTHEMTKTPLNPNGHAILDLALEPNAEAKIRERCPQASIRFDKLEQLHQLPDLRVPLNDSAAPNSQYGNNPFGIGRNRVS